MHAKYKNILIGVLVVVVTLAAVAWYIFNDKYADTIERKAAYTVNAMDFIKEFEKNDASPIPPKGPVQLQAHPPTEFRFKNIYIREIPADEANKMLAAKNADCEINEAQAVLRLPSRTYPEGAMLRTTHVVIPQARQWSAGVTPRRLRSRIALPPFSATRPSSVSSGADSG